MKTEHDCPTSHHASSDSFTPWVSAYPPCMSVLDQCATLKLIPANPDISGVGVRVAIYVQNLLSFIPAFHALKDGKISVKELQVVEKQSTTILITAFAVLISAMVQAATYGLYSFHTSIILSLSWMNNTNTFIYFLLYIQHKINPEPGVERVIPQWSAWFYHVVQPFKTDMRDMEKHDVEASGTSSGNSACSSRKGHEGKASRIAPCLVEHSLTHLKHWVIRWVQRCWTILRRNFVLVLGSFHLTAMAALGLWMWSSPYRYEATQATRLHKELDTIPLSCTNTTILGLNIPLTSPAVNRISLIFYSVFLAPCLNIVFPAGFFLLFFMQLDLSFINISMPRSVTLSNERPLFLNALKFAITTPAARAMKFLKSIGPTLTGLLFLLAINIVFIADIETTILRAKPYQDAKDESKWTFGQTLALLLLVLPIRDVYNYVRESREAEHAIEGTEELKRAVRRKDMKVLRKVAQYAADVNAYVDVDCPSALQFAAFQGDNEIVRTLLERRANANVEGGEHGPPLVAAAYAKHEHIVTTLVNVKDRSLGAAVGLSDKQGMTALHHAACHGLKDTVQFLLENNASADARNSGGETPLHCAAKCGDDSMFVHYRDVIDQLLCKSDVPESNINQVNNINGWSPLIYAAFHGRHLILDLLLQRGAAYSHRDEKGRPPLIHAAKQGHELAVQSLLGNGADINQSDHDGKTALIWAASEGHDRIVQLLLVYGANVSQAEADDKTPLIWATHGGHKRAVQLLLQHGAEPNQAEDSGKTPLIWAATKGHERVVQILVDSGADINQTENDGWTPLINAASWGQMAAIETLVASGADMKRSAKDGRAMLHLAAERGRLEVIGYLLEQGSDIFQVDNKGQTALSIAQEKGHEEIVTLLKDAMEQRKSPSTTEQPSQAERAHVDEDNRVEMIVVQPESASAPRALAGETEGRQGDSDYADVHEGECEDAIPSNNYF